MILYSGKDSAIHFLVPILITGSVTLPFLVFINIWITVLVITLIATILFVIANACTFKIEETEGNFVLTKFCFGICYSQKTTRALRHIQLDQDHDDSYASTSVICDFSGETISIGTKKNMHQILSALRHLDSAQ